MKNLYLTTHLIEGLNVFPKIENEARRPTLSTSIQHCTGGSTQCNKARKIKSIHIVKENVKVTLFVNDVIIYTKKSDTIYKKIY